LSCAPGIKPEDVMIEAKDYILTISGEHAQHTEEQHKHYVRRCGSFSRSMALPTGVDPSKITATTKDGIVGVAVARPRGGQEGEDRDHADGRLTLPLSVPRGSATSAVADLGGKIARADQHHRT
jgi:hypothetical protein